MFNSPSCAESSVFLDFAPGSVTNVSIMSILSCCSLASFMSLRNSQIKIQENNLKFNDGFLLIFKLHLLLLCTPLVIQLVKDTLNISCFMAFLIKFRIIEAVAL